MRIPVRRALITVCVIAGLLPPGLSAQDPVAPHSPALAAPSAIPQDGIPDILTGMAGGGGIARLFSGADHTPLIAGAPFGGFTGGVRVAAGDVTGDGVADLIVAQGPGGGLVKIFNGVDGLEIVSGYPFGPAFTGGVHVATGDIDADGHSDVVVGMGLGGWVRTYSVAGGIRLLNEGTPYGPGFTGGVRVAVGVNHDGTAAIATAPASGPGRVRVYHLSHLDGGPFLFASIEPYEPDFAGGVFVAMGDVTGDGVADIVTSASGGARPIQIFNGISSIVPDASGGTNGPAVSGGGHALLRSIGPGLPQGISVAVADLTGDGKAEVIGGAGPGGPPFVGVFDATTGGLLSFFLAEASTFPGGVLVAAPASSSGIRFTSAATTTFTTGTAGTFTVATSAVPTVTAITVTGTLPGGVTFTDNHDGTATLSGTPTPGAGGVHTLTFTATNGEDAPAAQTFTLRIEGPPQITSANATTFSVGGAGAFTVTTTGFPAPTITATGALPAGVTFSDNGTGTAALAGTPQPGTGGTYPLTITATNGVATAATQTFTLTVDASPVFTSANNTTFIAGAASAFAIAATAEPAITTITQTGALPAGITFLDNGGGSATLGGAPSVTGTFTLTLTAANGVGPNAMQTFTLTVQQTPTITSPDAATFTLGAASTFDVTTTGFPIAALSVAGSPPAGVSFVDDGDGTARLTGTPTASGTFALTIAATNGAGTDTQSFTLSVHQLPAIASPATATFIVGHPGTFDIVATGFPTPTIVQGGDAPPTGVSFIANGDGTGTLTGTPDPGTGGTYLLTFVATNSAGSSGVQAFTLHVNTALAITSADNTTFTAGVPGSFIISATGIPLPTINATGTFPAGVSFNPVTHTIEGTATASGAFPDIQVTATNGVSPDAAQTFTLNVVCPVITVSSTPPALPNGTFSLAYAGASFSQVGGGAGSWSASGLPAGLSIDSGTGAVSGTPAMTGLFNATITFTNTAGCTGEALRAFQIAPNADPDSYNAGLGNTQIVAADVVPLTPHVAYTDSVLANDDGPAGTLSVTPFSGPTALGGTVVVTATGGFTYTPGVGDTGNDSFSYTVTSNGVSATGTVTLGLGSQRVWYVQQGASGDGRSHSPFGTFATISNAGGAGDADGPNDFIYVYPGTYSSGFETEAGQTLWGAGALFNPLGGGLSIAAGERPTLQGTVTIAGNDVTVSSLAISAGTNFGMTNIGSPTNLTVKNGVTVATSTGAAVSFSNVNGSIGAFPDFGINFQSVSASNPGNGVVLNNVNLATGNFRVTGTGTLGSGGTISSSSGPGIVLTNVQNVSLSYMNITDSEDDGIRGTGVTNFSLHGSQVTGAGDAVGEHALDFGLVDGSDTANHLLGTASITNSLISTMYQHGITVENQSGTLVMTVTDTTIADNNSTIEGGDGILFQAGGFGTTAATMTLNVGETTANGCVFQNLNGDGIQVTSEANSTAGSIATLSVDGCLFSTVGGGSAGAAGVSAINGSQNRAFLDIRNSTIQNSEIVGISAAALDDSEVEAVILNNTIHTLGAETVLLLNDGGPGLGSPQIRATVRDNTMSGATDWRTVRAASRDGNGGTIHLQFEHNIVSAPIDAGFGGGDGVQVVAEDGMNICLDIRDLAPLGTNNSSAGTGEPGSGLAGYRLRNDSTGTFALEGYTTGTVADFFSSQNNVGSVVTPGTGVITMNGVCTTP